MKLKKVDSTTDKADDPDAQEHLQAEWCGLIASKLFQIKQTQLTQTSELCALAVYLTWMNMLFVSRFLDINSLWVWHSSWSSKHKEERQRESKK